MAMGDSISAGFAARGDLNEARDIAWSIGKGSAHAITLPWLLEQYSQLVEGQSTKAVSPVDLQKMPAGDYHPSTDRMNVAESGGAVTRGSMDEQWHYLQDNFKNYADFESRWKVLTVWMTANDVCSQCSDDVENTEMYSSWTAGYDKLLSNITDRLKNIYVNLVSTLDLSNVARIQKDNPQLCTAISRLFQECWCVNNGDAKQLTQLDRNIHVMNKRLHQFASDWQVKLQGRTDLAVVVQPFMEGIGTNLDSQFFSKLDCFHPNAAAHQDLAIGLWNSMLCTGDRKTQCGVAFKPNQTATCPTKDSVFYTGPDAVPKPLAHTIAPEAPLVV
jgi:hypothetical protein